MKKSVSLAVIAVTAGTLCAAPWVSLGPKRVPETLVVVSNYKSPRLLAELIQNECRAPYLLLPTPDSKDERIFFCPALPGKTAIQIREARLNAFVRFLHPKRIVVIGNDTLVNKRYIDRLDRTIPVVRIDGVDWYRMAEELNFMLNLSHLASNFKRLRETMLNNGRIYRPVSLPDGEKKAPAGVVPPAESAPAAESSEMAAPATGDAPAAGSGEKAAAESQAPAA
ncbi:MAG: hypothetical protein IJS01_15820 [Lentisphaeria bacterium]|nr:hypothetical protein [Lentisphaeria bacterium]